MVGARPSTTRTNEQGFTISELVVVLAVFLGLIMIVVVSVRGIDDDAAARECQTELRAVKASSERFKAELGVYPPDDKALQDAGYMRLDESPNWKVVTLDPDSPPIYKRVGDRCK